jgi:hypothetical protein
MRRLVYEQYWPWQAVAELEQDLSSGFSDPESALNEEIRYILDLGYRPHKSIVDDIASQYTIITYTFWLLPRDITALLLQFPESRSLHPV